LSNGWGDRGLYGGGHKKGKGPGLTARLLSKNKRNFQAAGKSERSPRFRRAEGGEKKKKGSQFRLNVVKQRRKCRTGKRNQGKKKGPKQVLSQKMPCSRRTAEDAREQQGAEGKKGDQTGEPAVAKPRRINPVWGGRGDTAGRWGRRRKSGIPGLKG